MRAEPAVLRLGDRTVAEYAWRPELPGAMSPRPYLHPVQTYAGTVVTEVMPSSHRHHLGVSIAVEDVDGHNFWGSRTFVPGHGPAWLNNHGTQEHVRWVRRTPTRLEHALRWMTIDRERLLTERRSWSARPVSPEAWALTCEFALTNAAGRTLRIQSPASIGRAGAGFGGLFWHARSGPGQCRVLGAAGDGTEAVNGSRSDWLAVSAATGEQRQWTLVFIAASPQTRDDRWFLRSRDYIGVGSALAFDDPLLVEPGATVTRRIVVVVADGVLNREQAAELAAELTA